MVKVGPAEFHNNLAQGVSTAIAAGAGAVKIAGCQRKTLSPARPLVIHNIGQGAREEDTLFAFSQTGRYRFAPA